MTDGDRPALRRRLRAARRAIAATERPGAAAAIDAALRSRRMRFATGGDGAEGVAPVVRSGHWLDLVLVPLVGFDARGNRLGMGGGFYDRHFAFLRNRQAWRRPLLIGIAFDVQRVPRLSGASHDVPLWGIVTERGTYGRAAAHARSPSRGSGR
jgi:5-formyltetrahydrofolate cyclo-ligase